MNSINNLDLCYLLGAFLGDGCAYIGKSAYQFSITSEDEDFCIKCQNICQKLINKSGKIRVVFKENRVSYYQLVICSKELVLFLIEQTKNKSMIPMIVYDNTENKRCFLRGIMDADGWISRVQPDDGYTRYRVGFKNIFNFTSDIFGLFRDCNIRTGILRAVDNDRGSKDIPFAYTFSINTHDYCEKLGFGIKRKTRVS